MPVFAAVDFTTVAAVVALVLLSALGIGVVLSYFAGVSPAVNRVVAKARQRNVYRGQVLVDEQAGFATPHGERDFQIHFHDLPKVGREQSVLPDEVLKVVERNVIGLLAHAETLRKAGRSTR